VASRGKTRYCPKIDLGSFGKVFVRAVKDQRSETLLKLMKDNDVAAKCFRLLLKVKTTFM
jgi:hypothetical protein